MTAAKVFLVLGLVFAPVGAAQQPGDAAPDFTLLDGGGRVGAVVGFSGRARPAEFLGNLVSAVCGRTAALSTGGGRNDCDGAARQHG